METTFLLWTLALWGLLTVCAIVNGAFRMFVLLKRLGKAVAHFASSAILSSIVLLVWYAFLSTTSIRYSDSDLWLAGLIWLSITMLFEFGFGHFVMKRSWNVLLEDYNLIKGRVWVVVLIVTLVGPYLMGRLV